MEILIYNGLIINNGQALRGSILINEGKIKQIFPDNHNIPKVANILDATDKFILPGAIDTHVHFREPGLTHKATIYTESRAALVGGVTTFFDMPNTLPPTTTERELAEKIKIAKQSAATNYAFYIAATHSNISEIQSIPKNIYPGIKIFYAPSTGNLLCNDHHILEQFFKTIDKPFVIHSEDLATLTEAQKKCQEISPIPENIHSFCRPSQACFKATNDLINLINHTQAQAHFLHITTKEEIALFRNNTNPRVSAEVCPHYLWFDSNDYKRKGNLIKVNPSIKLPQDRQELINALKDKVINTIGTDHAPHLKSEKQQNYFQSPSGVPSVQHFYPVIFQIFANHNINFSLIPFFTAHNPAKIFHIKNRGFISPGQWADIAIIERTNEFEKKIYHKCGWSVFEEEKINYRVLATLVNGQIAWLHSSFYNVKTSLVEFF